MLGVVVKLDDYSFVAKLDDYSVVANMDEDYSTTVIYDSTSLSERLLAATVERAWLVDRAKTPLTTATELNVTLMSCVSIPARFVTLSPMPLFEPPATGMFDMLTQLGVEEIFIASNEESDEYTHNCTSEDTVTHSSVVKRWKAPKLPTALRGTVSIALASIAYTLDGYAIPQCTVNEARAFAADVTAHLDAAQQLELFIKLRSSYDGCDVTSAIIQRGHGRILERRRVLEQLVGAGAISIAKKCGVAELDAEIAEIVRDRVAKAAVRDENVVADAQNAAADAQNAAASEQNVAADAQNAAASEQHVPVQCTVYTHDFVDLSAQ